MKTIPEFSLTKLLDTVHIVGVFEECGGLIIKNVLSKKSVIDLKKESIRFFSNDQSYLLQFKRKTIESAGYTTYGGESVRGLVTVHDRHFFDIMADTGNTIFPPEFPRFSKLSRETFQKLEQISLEVVNLLSRNIRYPQIKDDVLDGRHMLRISQYRIEKVDQNFIIFPGHRDFGLLTLVTGGLEDGLQVLLDDQWHTVHIDTGDIFIFPGSTLHIYEPKIRALPHRVVALSDKRLSVVFFTEPREDATLPDGTKASGRLKAYLEKISNQ